MWFPFQSPDMEITMRFVVSLTLLLTCFTTASKADQVVRATWYGNEHRGHRTASGEMFNRVE